MPYYLGNKFISAKIRPDSYNVKSCTFPESLSLKLIFIKQFECSHCNNMRSRHKKP